MLFFKNITKFFGTQILFESADFQVNSRERVGLIGRNGNGKSTLLRLIENTDFLDDGTISYPEHYRIGILDQHLKFSQDTVVAEVLQALEKNETHQQWRAEKLLSGLGFAPEDFEKSPSVFSGGFQMRIKLAQLLLSEPDLLLLDEPTNYLDILSIRWLESFLCRWKTEILCVSHDHDFLHNICTHTAVIHRKKIKKIKGSPEKLYNQIQLEEEIHEKTRKNESKEQVRQEKFIREFRSGARSAGLVQSRIKMLEKKEKKHALPVIQQVRFAFPECSFSGARVFEAHNISFGYTEDQDLLHRFSFEILPHDKVGIIGKNGKGKTTLLRILAKQLRIKAGTLKGHPNNMQGYFGQSNVNLFDPKKNILEEIACNESISEQHARNIAGSLLFSGGLAHKKIEVLSGGEKARVNLGKIFATPTNLLLLDEPTNHLDYESIEELIRAIKTYSQTIVFVSHNEQFLREVATKLIVFDEDEVFIYKGSYKKFLNQKGFSHENFENDTSQDKPKKTLSPSPQRNKKESDKLTRPLRRKIERIEEKITKLEKSQNSNKEEFVTAKRRGNVLRIDQLLSEGHHIETQIQKEFEKALELEQEIIEVERGFSVNSY